MPEPLGLTPLNVQPPTRWIVLEISSAYDGCFKAKDIATLTADEFVLSPNTLTAETT